MIKGDIFLPTFILYICTDFKRFNVVFNSLQLLYILYQITKSFAIHETFQPNLLYFNENCLIKFTAHKRYIKLPCNGTLLKWLYKVPS